MIEGLKWCGKTTIAEQLAVSILYHYRDRDRQECDVVIHLRNGKFGLIEIKLGGDKLIEEGAKSVKTMEAKSIPIR